MKSQYDLVIRNGTILDGTGGDPVDGDVAIEGGVIRDVGHVAGRGADEVDAKGCFVTPGFVDIHTHYDGQATWDSCLAPSSWHGATTVVMGNCGVGFAPCRAGDRGTLVRLMEGVEDIPGAALAEGLPWTWQTFPEFLDVLEARPHDVDFAAMLPHGALRVFAMGDRGVRRARATAEDIASMTRVAAEALRAGAIGLSTSRTVLHRTADGDPTPMFGAARTELVGIADALGRERAGVFQMVSDFREVDLEFAMLVEIAERTRRPVSFSLAQNDYVPGQWRELLRLTEAAAARRLALRAQVFTRPIGLVMGLDTTLHPLQGRPSYDGVSKLPRRERWRRLSDPDLRARILSEAQERAPPFFAMFGERWDRYFPMGDPPDYEPQPDSSILCIARRRDQDPLAVVYDALLAGEGSGLLYVPFLNFANGSLDAVHEMMIHPSTVFGLADGGAHVGTISDASATTTTLTHWGRDRKGARLPLPWLVRFLTRAPAEAVGLLDRGLVAPGKKADLVVLDLDRCSAARPQIHWDLPAGGRRFLQRAAGYRATIVSGQITYRDGVATGALPGRLVRGQTAEHCGSR
jgi:N-acyl-D-aspartate/D-glutamate deacylase